MERFFRNAAPGDWLRLLARLCTSFLWLSRCSETHTHTPHVTPRCFASTPSHRCPPGICATVVHRRSFVQCLARQACAQHEQRQSPCPTDTPPASRRPLLPHRTLRLRLRRRTSQGSTGLDRTTRCQPRHPRQRRLGTYGAGWSQHRRLGGCTPPVVGKTPAVEGVARACGCSTQPHQQVSDV